MKYYILYPDQTKDNIDYDRQLVAESGVNTIYLKPAFQQIIHALSVIEAKEFEEKFCDPAEIIIFDENGNDEHTIDQFTNYIGKKYKHVEEDF